MTAQRNQVEPGLTDFLARTWSGRIVLINFLIFLLMAYESGSLVMPTLKVLDQFGAKDVVAISLGEWWRFITPIFMHIGLMHFAFNSYALYVIGPQIEEVFGARWFLLIYFLAGIFGNVCSAVYSVNLSAGASGAIVGLLGSGLYLEQSIRKRMEQTTGHRPRAGAYLINTVMMIGLGVMIPNIDNAAHFGGLFSGFVCAAGILRIRPNRLYSQAAFYGYAAIIFVVILLLAGAQNAADSDRVAQRYLQKIDDTPNLGERVYLASRALALDEQGDRLLFVRGESLILLGELYAGLQDLSRIARIETFRNQIEILVEKLRTQKRAADAKLVEALLNEFEGFHSDL